MTLAHYESPSVSVVPTHQDIAVQRLAEWAQSADAAYRVAQRLVESSFVPQGFRGKPVEATAAILAGTEVGLSPMSALRAFDVIQGQAAPRAMTLRAIAQAAGHDIEVVESTATRCRVRCRRRGGEWQSPPAWTIDRARELGLTGKSNWKQQPIAMLLARATAEAARLVAADAILGIAYSAEEIADGGTVDPAPISDGTEPPATRRMSRRRTEPTPSVEEPPLEPAGVDEFHPDTTTNPEVEYITDAQLRKLQATYTDVGIKDRAERLAHASAFVGRELGSSKELTKAEASGLIEALADLAAPPTDELWPEVAHPGGEG